MDGNGPAKTEYDAVIVGAGPTGSYSAYRLAKTGMNVLMIDRKNSVGDPVQCAGLVNSTLFQLEGLSGSSDRTVLKKISGADLYSPAGDLMPLRGNEVKACSIDRSLFDKELLRMSVREGVEFLPNTTVTRIDPKRNRIFSDNCDKALKADLIVGADGPASTVRRNCSLGDPSETLPGISMECTIKGATVPPNKVGVFTGKSVARGFFAWAIPSFDSYGVRLGLSALSGINLKSGLNNLLNDWRLAEFLSLDVIRPDDISFLTRTYGGVPMGSLKNISVSGVLLLGDAAGMAKPTSGGGILPSLRAADLLASIIENDGYSGKETLKKFEEKWNKGYGRELLRSMILRKIIRELPDSDINKAVAALNDEDKLEFINSTGDIDRPIPLAINLLKMDPSLMRLIPRYLPHLRKFIRK